jgi:hypothetical protein
LSHRTLSLLPNYCQIPGLWGRITINLARFSAAFTAEIAATGIGNCDPRVGSSFHQSFTEKGRRLPFSECPLAIEAQCRLLRPKCFGSAEIVRSVSAAILSLEHPTANRYFFAASFEL